MKGTYKVVLNVATDHSYTIDEVNSPEEAIVVAERMFKDGEPGSVTFEDVTSWDAYLDEEGEET
jgi:hypothetical protein